MTVLSTIRQLWFPREFRIPALQWPAKLEQLLQRLSQTGEARAESTGSTAVQQDFRLFADIGTGLWRLRQKMVKPGTAEPLDEMRRPYRHVEAVWDALVQAGVEIQDHTDKDFDSGMSLKVVAFQPTAGLRREQVIETIKPTVYFRGKVIQIGQVIVGTPDEQELPPANQVTLERGEDKEWNKEA